MSPGLLLPAALSALAALAIPIVIHIARRTESRTVAFAALRWLTPRARPRRRPRIDERWLLAVRLLLLALIALHLAQPVLWGAADQRPIIALAPGVDADTIAIDMPSNARRVWLAPGFPAVGDAPPSATSNPVSLIRQLDAETASGAPITLIVPATLEGVDAERPRLSRQVEWRVQPATPLVAPTAMASPALTVRYSAEAEDAVRYFRAAAIAWARPDTPPAFEALPADRPVEASAHYLVWLANGPLPDQAAAWIRNGGTALLSHDADIDMEGEPSVAWRDGVGAPLAVSARLGRGRILKLTRPLQPATLPQLAEADFPAALERMLAPPPAPARVAATDHAPLAGAKPYPQPALDLRPWLALLIALVFGVERWLATRRRRAAAP